MSTQLEAACDELIRTEETYVRNLECIVEVFQNPLRTWAQEEAAGPARSSGVTVEEIDVLFGSTTILLDVNKGLLAQLKSGAGSSSMHSRATSLAATMATWAAGPLRIYAPHVRKFSAVCALLDRLLAKRARFRAAVRVLELQPASRGQRLQALLVNTVQRLPRYTLLLKEILKNIGGGGGGGGLREASELLEAARGDTASLIAGGMDPSTMLHLALEKIHAVTVRVNFSVGDEEQRSGVVRVCREVLRRDDLIAPSRALLKEGALVSLRRKWATSERVVASKRLALLFSDLLVLHAANESDGTRILPLADLVLVTSELVRCRALGRSRTLPYDANAADQ